MLQPLISPTPPTAVNPGLITPRPPTQQQTNATSRNVSASPVTRTDEAEDALEDNQESHNERVTGQRSVTGFFRSGSSHRGINLDIFV
ncbi:MAG: hypothetical protein HQ481_00970 [Alphaproteobacteria bacterium]|nr:hypothetical protein [Alphaproteobacteria bacterium]